MSIAPNVGAINKYLGSIIASPVTRVREKVKAMIEKASHIVAGRASSNSPRRSRRASRTSVARMLFEELGFRYFGPIDGHNLEHLVQTMEIVKRLQGPRVMHVITEKGQRLPLFRARRRAMTRARRTIR